MRKVLVWALAFKIESAVAAMPMEQIKTNFSTNLRPEYHNSPFLIATILGILLAGQLSRIFIQLRVRRKFRPRTIEPFPRGFPHRHFPIRAHERDWRRLGRALNKQTQFVSPLRRARDFFAAPEQVGFFMAGKTLSWQRFFAARRKLGFNF
jgi:hypothetical protein